MNDDYSRLDGPGKRPAPNSSAMPGMPGPLARIAGLAIGTLVAVGALFVSVIAFSIVAAVAAIVGGWIWWRTRDLRKQLQAEMERMREAAARGEPAGNADPFGGFGSGRAGRPSSAPADRGDVIDGDLIREVPRTGQTPRE